MEYNLANFTDVLSDADEIANSQPLSLPSSGESVNVVQGPVSHWKPTEDKITPITRPAKRTGQYGDFRSIEEIDSKYRHVFTYPYFNLVQSSVIEDAVYSDKSMVVCAPTGSGKTVVFEMAIVQLLMELDDRNYTGDFKIVYMAPVKALCTERLSEWYPKFTKLGLMCIEVTGDTNVDFSQLKPYRIIITTPEKWDMLTRRWRDHRSMVEVVKLFLIDEVHILNDSTRGPVLEAVVSRMKTIEASQQSAHRIEQLQKQYQEGKEASEQRLRCEENPPRIRFIAVSATVSNPEDVAAWLGSRDKPAVYYKFGDECRPVKLKRVVEGYPCPEGMSIFKFDIILNYKLWPVIQKYHDGKPTLIFCNTRKSVALTAEMLSRELTINFTPEQKVKLTALASTIKNKKLQALVLSGVGCHHAGLLYEERLNIEEAFRNRDLPILITTTTLAMGVNLPAHLVIIKNTQQYVNGAYQEYSISTVLQMVGRAGRPQFDTEATAVIMTRMADKARYQALVGGDEPLQSYLHKRLPENLNSEAALGTVGDVAQCVQWLRSTFLCVRASKDPKRYLGLPMNAPSALISKKIEELCVKAMNGLASAGLITMDEASCIESTEAGRLMSIYYLDLETMKHIMKIEGNETLEKLLWIVCESHELADMHLRMDERRTLNALNRNNAATTIRFPMKGKICTRQMKLNCIIQAVLGCLPISEPALNQEASKIMRIADRVCKCLVAYVTRSDLIARQPANFSAVINAVTLAKCIKAHLWENSPYVSKQLKGIGPTFSALLASAGKVNFTLLEESHPRDLERIMNKSAPAGNVLRKQVGLLPRYQLTATPIDEKKVTIKLVLLNHHHLAENREQLTAGLTHKCYLVAGDSDNNLLYFTVFKDQDLISVYDGIITYEVTRKHGYEHKVFVHCISSNWVGLDVNCEYVFKNTEPTYLRAEAVYPSYMEEPHLPASKKQTRITDTYKERKRKSNELNITQSKEKKKRDNALIEQFKVLKNSFEVTPKGMKEDINKSAEISDKLVHEIVQSEKKCPSPYEVSRMEPSQNITKPHCNLKLTCNKIDVDFPTIDIEDLANESDDIIYEPDLTVDDKINSILKEIESEISKDKSTSDKAQNHSGEAKSTFCNKPLKPNEKYLTGSTMNRFPKLEQLGMYKYTPNRSKKRKSGTNTKSNYSFLDAIGKNEKELPNLHDNNSEKYTGFSDTIKNQVEKFLQKATKIPQSDPTLKLLETLPEPESNTTLTTHHREESEVNSKIDHVSDKHQLLSQELPLINISKDDTFGQISALEKNADTKIVSESLDSETIQNMSVRKQKNEVCPRSRIDLTEICNDRDKKVIINNYKEFNRDDNTSIEVNDIIKENVNDKNEETEDTKSNKEVEEDIVSNVETVAEIKDINNKCDNKDENDKDEIPNYKISKETTQTGNNFITSDIPALNTYKPIQDNSIYQEMNKIFLPYNANVKIYGSKNSKELNLHRLSNMSLNTEELYQVTKNAYVKNFPKLEQQSAVQQKFVYKHPNPANGQVRNEAISNNPNNRSSGSHFEYNRATAGAHGERNDFVYRNQYCFTATNIDVCTKDMPDHKLQIIRKIKLDLDVTELATKINKNVSLEFAKDFGEDFGSPSSQRDLQDNFISNDEHNRHSLVKNNQYQTDTGSNKQSHEIAKKSLIVSRKLSFFTKSNSPQESNFSTEIKDGTIINSLKNYYDNNSRPTEENRLKQYEEDKSLKLYRKTNENTTKSIDSLERTNKDIQDEQHKEQVKGSSLEQYTRRNENASNLMDEAFKHQNKDIQDRQRKEEENVGSLQPHTKTNENTSNFMDKAFEHTNKHIQANSTENENNKKVMNINSSNAKQCFAPEKKEFTENQTQPNKDIASILQKYSSILRKDNKIFDTKPGGKTLSQDERKKCFEKIKRVHKINDIHKVNIPLPKSLIYVEATRSIKPEKDVLNKIKYEHKEETPEIANIEKFVKSEQQKHLKTEINVESIEDCLTSDLEIANIEKFVKSEQQKHLKTEINVESIEDCLTSDLEEPEELECLSMGTEITQPEIQDEFSLDQSMLNPRTLLQQCFSKDVDELIIPPPNEFCENDATAAQDKINEDVFNEISECLEGEKEDIDRSIFEEIPGSSVLTPTKEIETWTFPNEDEEFNNSNSLEFNNAINPMK